MSAKVCRGRPPGSAERVFSKAAPFKRNDQMLAALPIGGSSLPRTGIQDNLADKPRKLGIPVWKFGKGDA